MVKHFYSFYTETQLKIIENIKYHSQCITDEKIIQLYKLENFHHRYQTKRLISSVLEILKSLKNPKTKLSLQCF